ncbi:hypothetical protein U1Q18_002951 [Sarracenia purpurea var. burkii]
MWDKFEFLEGHNFGWGCSLQGYERWKVDTEQGGPEWAGRRWAGPIDIPGWIVLMRDWADLWRPELAGKIAMVHSSREVVGAVLKCMGASYNANSIDAQVAGGRNAVQQKLAQLQKQVRLFDSVHYLKAFGVGDVWVAVGWSSDVLPAAKRMSNVAVIVPKSGASLWADLWVC